MQVLLIESNPRLLKRALEKKGFSVAAAQNGADADEKARSGAYAVIVLERELANHDVMSLLKQWRSDGMESHVLILSDGTSLQDRIDAFSHGADDYLTKPYQQEELVARLRVAVRRQPGSASEAIRLFDLEIEPMSRRVKRAGRLIDLTPREYDLLLFLLRHRGKPVSRALIWDQLYDEQEERRSNVIDVYIRYLRKKIDDGAAVPLIITCWGQGYMLRGDQTKEPEA